MNNYMKTHPILKMFNQSLVSLPTPSNISFNWNFGSLLGLTLIMQMITGIVLACSYAPENSISFTQVIMMTRNINMSWLFRVIHSNGASMFFLLLFLHIGRNMYYNTSKNKETWGSGVTLLFLLMATAFLGYVLPWGQMSFWGVSVITNLLSAIPYIGHNLVTWLWGGTNINSPTLNRFYALHYLLPFITTLFVIFHLVSLHKTGSSNPMTTNSNLDKSPFHPFFTIKDLMGITMVAFIFSTLILTAPLMFNDPENFILSNPMITPIHIQPEWYFLFAYAILRSIPNKLGGVIALLMSIMILMTPPLSTTKIRSLKFNPLKKIVFWSLITIFLMLTWIGANPVEPPFIMVGQAASFLYFTLFLIMFPPQ